MDIVRVFARNLRLARNKSRMSQDELAAKAGVTKNYISDLEQQKYNPTIKVVQSLAEALHLSASDLVSQDFDAASQ